MAGELGAHPTLPATHGQEETSDAKLCNYQPPPRPGRVATATYSEGSLLCCCERETLPVGPWLPREHHTFFKCRTAVRVGEPWLVATFASTLTRRRKAFEGQRTVLVGTRPRECQWGISAVCCQPTRGLGEAFMPVYSDGLLDETLDPGLHDGVMAHEARGCGAESEPQSAPKGARDRRLRGACQRRSGVLC